MQPTPPTKPTKFCLKCFYPLDGLDTWRCPECGEPFNPYLRDTYSDEPRRPRRHRSSPSRMASAIMLVVSLAIGYLLYHTPILLIPGLACILFPMYPFWQVANIWLAMNLVVNDRYDGLIFWVPVGCAFGALSGLFQGTYLTYFGFLLGPVVGLVRAHWEG